MVVRVRGSLLWFAIGGSVAIRGFTQHATFPPSGGLPFQTNLYLVYDTATNDALVIDTGFKTGPNDSGLLTFAANNNLDIQSVISAFNTCSLTIG